MIISQTPLRISLLGGGTDLKEYYKIRDGFVVSTAIDKYVFIIVKERFDDLIYVNYSSKERTDSPLKIKHDLVREALLKAGVNKGIEITMLADIPSEGSGLGSSSSLLVGLLNALYMYQGIQVTAERLAKEACNIEINKCKKPIGKQDQYIAAYGGLCSFKFKKTGQVEAKRLNLTESEGRVLGSNMLLFYTGITRQSSEILTEQRAKTKNMFTELNLIKSLAEQAVVAINSKKYDKIGTLLRKNWKLIVPSLLGMLMGIGFALVFIVMNDLISLISTDPSSLFITGGISAMAKKVSSVLINQSQIIKIVLSLLVFVMANFMAGSSLIGMKYSMIKDTMGNKKTPLIRSFFKGTKYYWKIVEMRVMVLILIVILSVLLSFPFFILSRYFGDGPIFVLLSVILILLVIKLILFFRYPILIRNGLRAIPSLNKAINIFKKNTKYVFGTWLITIFFMFSANLLFDFVRISITDYLYYIVILVVLMVGFYILKELLMVIVNTFVDVFGYVSYVRLRKK